MTRVLVGLLGLVLLAGAGARASADPIEDLAGSRDGRTALTAARLLESQPVEIVERLRRDDKLVILIGTHLLPTDQTVADHGELLRTIGFSSAPGTLRILCLFPPIAGWVYLLATRWMLIAMVVGVRQALDYDRTGRGTARAIAVCAIGSPVYALFLVVTLLALGPWPV
ncbi:MAG: hypothetical protein QNK03_28610 [Myxococcota bacterium]|nr:hypothetical protein [Myxococcota bacterium]